MPLDNLRTATSLDGALIGEARRQIEICNACRYCEGFCAVFPAMEQRRVFSDHDLHYLANLCHDCRGCYYACQYAPPHEFAINIPKIFAAVRTETYKTYAWPRALAGAFSRNGLVVALTLAACLALIFGLTAYVQAPEILFGIHKGAGAFYTVIPYEYMVGVASVVFFTIIAALSAGFIRFVRDVEGGWSPAMFLRAAHDALTLRFKSNSGDGCNYPGERFSMTGRWLHQFTMWGFLFCFAATAVAAVYDHVFGLVAPYAYTSLPVLLGAIGGVGLLIGPAGLFWLKLKSDKRPASTCSFGMDYAFIVLLFLTALTGMLLLAFRETSAMGVLLAVHLGIVLALFATMPYGKFVHAVYRFAALVRYGRESR